MVQVARFQLVQTALGVVMVAVVVLKADPAAVEQFVSSGQERLVTSHQRTREIYNA